MSVSSKVFAAYRRTPLGDDNVPRRLERPSLEEIEALQLFETHRVNLMLMGTGEVAKRAMVSVGERLQPPVAQWSPGEQFQLPAPEEVATVVLNDVGALNIPEQIRLLEWLAGAQGRTQVVSTTPTPLLPRVRAGSFIDALYYRLNIVCLDGTA